jgi:hypothetical protein
LRLRKLRKKLPHRGNFSNSRSTTENAVAQSEGRDKTKKIWYTFFMRMIKVVLLGIGAILLSCVSNNGNNVSVADRPVQDSLPDDVSNALGESGDMLISAGAEEFDPKNPPLAIYTETKYHIQNFVQRVDALIKAKNYGEWTKLLSRDYFERISSSAFLNDVSQQPRLKSQNIVLHTSREYFLNIVVPSRINLEANDIEFITLTRVMAFTINQAGQRIRIYTLDKTGDSWEIID